ncbi:hypothetical protein E3P99_03994 [Wallemia hederae]|uniref:Uncharacterized protein n=1 Tax=Wallemia hederae TaxID=1540922 RepID=A0A4T0FBM3_9BASI|nr:hypothetical protein E3P99_03994 [Wallemia hederae]
MISVNRDLLIMASMPFCFQLFLLALKEAPGSRKMLFAETSAADDVEKFSEEDTAKSIAAKYLSVGEFCYDTVTGYAVNSAYFKRGDRR